MTSTGDVFIFAAEFSFIEDLQYSVPSLVPVTAQSLCVLDLHAFVCCVVHETKQRLAGMQTSQVPDDDVMTTLPLLLSSELATSEQREWWTAAYKLLTNQAR